MKKPDYSTGVHRRKYRIPKGRSGAGEERTAQRYSVEFVDHRGLARRLVAFESLGRSKELRRKLMELAAFRAAGETPDPGKNSPLARV